MNKLNIYLICIGIFLLLSAIVFSGVLTQLYNGSNLNSIENLTFNSGGNLTRNISINKFANILNSTINISGFPSQSDISNSTLFTLNLTAGYTNANFTSLNFVYVNISTSNFNTKVNCFFTGDAITNTTLSLYKNDNIISNNFTHYYCSGFCNGISGNGNPKQSPILIYVNASASDNISLKLEATSNNCPNWVYNITFLNGTYLLNPYLQLNGTNIWQYYGNFTGINNKTNNFWITLQNSLNQCVTDSTNICQVPITFHSDSGGIIQYSDLNITYDGEPLINSNVTVPASVKYGEGKNVVIMANVTSGSKGYGIINVNFTLVSSNGSIVINNTNTTFFDGKTLWNSSSYSIVNATTNLGTWRWNITATNNVTFTANSSGSFSITDTINPRIINVTSPQNNSLLSESTIIFNWSVLDDVEVQSAWYQKDSNSSNNITFTPNNNFSTVFGLNNHNLTVFANDSSNNLVSTFFNFTVLGDTTPPTITIITPLNGGTVTSSTVTSSHSITDNVALSSCTYSVYQGSNLNIANTTIANCATNSSFVYTTISGCASTSYTLYLWANDTFGLNTTVSSTYSCVTPGGGGSSVGGGGGSPNLQPINGSCTKNADCSSSLCDLSKGSTHYGTCQNTLCGNNVFDTGENIATCGQDASFGGINLAPGFAIKFVIVIIVASFLLLIVASREGKIKKFWKWLKDVL